MADHVKRIIEEYNAGKPWYDINGDEISLDDFINIYEEEKAYEKKCRNRSINKRPFTNN